MRTDTRALTILLRSSTFLWLASWIPTSSAVAAPQFLELPTALTFDASVLSCATGDFDGDGKVDVAFGCGEASVPGYVAICRNLGDRNFAPPVVYAVSAQPVRLRVLDLEGDGHVDIVAACTGSPTAVELRNLGDGTFAVAPTNLIAHRSMRFADLDGDGDEDLVSYAAGYGTIQRCNGGGSFASGFNFTSSVIAQPLSFEVADLDGDGDLDLCAVPSGSTYHFIELWKNNGDATFAAPVLLATTMYPQSAVAHDFDSDGDVDLAVAGDLSLVTFFWNPGDGSFSTTSDVLPQDCGTAMLVTDVDEDGDGDLVLGCSNFGRHVLRNQGAQSFTVSERYVSAASISEMTCADLDGDGHVDLVFANGTIRSGWIDWNRSDGSFTRQAPTMTADCEALAAGDMDGDGDLDLATRTLSGGIRILSNAGDGSLTVAGTYPAQGLGALAVADLDGDHDLDVVTGQTWLGSSYGYAISKNLGGGVMGPLASYPLTYGTARGIAARDFDGDGDVDVCVTGAWSSAISRMNFLVNDGTGTFTPGLDLAISPLAYGTVAGDFDSDGDVDLVTAHDYFDLVAMHRNLGGWTFGPEETYAFGPNDQVLNLAAADFDRDGDLDLVVSVCVRDTVALGHAVIYTNQGNGTFSAPVRYPTGVQYSYATALETADVDGDGWTDILVGCWAAKAVALLRNTGTGTFDTTHQIPARDRMRLASVGDFDGDGDQDLIVSVEAGALNLLRNSKQCGLAFCFGDGAATSCPCANTGAPGRGCANSATSSGARLDGAGVASVVDDRVKLRTAGVPSGPGLYFQGTSRLANGDGVTFGDGLRCVGGAVTRLGVSFASGDTSRFPTATGARLSVLGGVVAGDVRHYQTWYRDTVPTFCSSSLFNLSNAVTVTWRP